MIAERPCIRPRPRLVSVVIPARNAGSLLREQLVALGEQKCDLPWELIVVDNGCTDDTIRIASECFPLFQEARIVEAHDRAGASYARNCGAGAAQGDFLAFCDADDIVEPGWLAAMVGGASQGDFVGGWLKPTASDGRLTSHGRPNPDRLDIALGFLPFAPAGNLGIWRDVLQSIGGWSEAYAGGGEDVELSWRAQIAGFQPVFSPAAIVRHRQRASLWQSAKQRYRYGLMDARLLHEHREHGARRASARDFVHAVGWLIVRLPYLLSRESRLTWIRVAATRMGRLRGGLRYRSIFI